MLHTIWATTSKLEVCVYHELHDFSGKLNSSAKGGVAPARAKINVISILWILIYMIWRIYILKQCNFYGLRVINLISGADAMVNSRVDVDLCTDVWTYRQKVDLLNKFEKEIMWKQRNHTRYANTRLDLMECIHELYLWMRHCSRLLSAP